MHPEALQPPVHMRPEFRWSVLVSIFIAVNAPSSFNALLHGHTVTEKVCVGVHIQWTQCTQCSVYIQCTVTEIVCACIHHTYSMHSMHSLHSVHCYRDCLCLYPYLMHPMHHLYLMHCYMGTLYSMRCYTATLLQKWFVLVFIWNAPNALSTFNALLLGHAIFSVLFHRHIVTEMLCWCPYSMPPMHSIHSLHC